MKDKHKLRFELIIMMSMLLGACSSGAPEWASDEMGASVLQMVEGQIHDAEAAANPGDAAVSESDGAKAEKVMAAWRESLTKAKEEAGDVVINVGN